MLNSLVKKLIQDAGGSLERQEDSHWAILIWRTQPGHDYTETTTLYGFFPEDKRTAAKEIVFGFEPSRFMFGEVMDLTLPDVDAHFTLRAHTCSHCGAQVFNRGGQFKTKPYGDLSQYCWVDPKFGSQLHDVEAEDQGE